MTRRPQIRSFQLTLAVMIAFFSGSSRAGDPTDDPTITLRNTSSQTPADLGPGLLEGLECLQGSARSFYLAHFDAGGSEVSRIRKHLLRVEGILRDRDASDLSPPLRKRRAAHLNRLHDYAEDGVFPRNDRLPALAPFFIDSMDRACAVADLMIHSGAEELARAVSRQHNNSFVGEIDTAGVASWVAESGLTGEELAMIQPCYLPCFSYWWELTDLTAVCAGSTVVLTGFPTPGIVYRDGLVIGSVVAGAVEFTDGPVPEGLHTYAVDSGGHGAVAIIGHHEICPSFIRGDASGDGSLDIADAVAALAHLFSGDLVDCLVPVDTNDDGLVDVADPIYLLSHLFGSGPDPAPPYPGCGFDPTPDALGCSVEPSSCASTPASPFPYSISGYHETSGLATFGDVNGDGVGDLITNDFFDSIALLPGIGDGSFGAAIPLFPGFLIPELHDLDGDGDLDLFLLSAIACGFYYTQVEIRLNDGQGGFVAGPPLFSVGQEHLVADVTGDSLPDIISVETYAGVATLWVGAGGGTFAQPTPLYAQLSFLSGLAVGDWDGDGDTDIALKDGTDLVALLSDGLGGFSPPITTASTNFATLISVGDLDGDGDDDLLHSDVTGLVVLLSSGNGSFTAAPVPIPTSSFTLEVQRADLDSDGVQDLLTLEIFNSPVMSGSTTFSMWRGLGGGAFEAERVLQIPTTHASAVLEDLNGDGAIDILLGGVPCDAQYFLVLLRTVPTP